MNFTLSIDCDSDAFAADPTAEIARILRKTAQRLVSGADSGRLLDVNGNTVGEFTTTLG